MITGEQLAQKQRMYSKLYGNERKNEKMKNHISMEQMGEVLQHPDTRAFLKVARETLGVRSAGYGNIGLTIPENLVWIIRDEANSRSKLLPFVHVVRAKGLSRVAIPYTEPEGVWTDVCDAINQLDLDFRAMLFEGSKLSGYFTVCNTLIEDDDRFFLEAIISGMGIALAKALDKAILFGTGDRMPLGITARLAQTEEPDWWEPFNPSWYDLHETHIQKMPLDTMYGAPFLHPIVEALSIAEPVYSEDGLFWAMNRKTHREILAKTLVNYPALSDRDFNFMPGIGGSVVEFPADMIPDNQIIGGYGSNYLLAERGDPGLATSDQVKFLEDQTIYKAYGYYDGAPVAGEAFVVLRFDGSVVATDPVLSVEFAKDIANPSEPTTPTDPEEPADPNNGEEPEEP